MTEPGTDDQQNHLSVSAIRRIGKDVKDIMCAPREGISIRYIHSTTSVNRGYAMVVGTSDTPYFCVPMFYRFDFPADYPHSPPKMTFLTHSSHCGKNVRLHPNYYTNGKCCLSILNSWSGEKWTGCQTIRSVLLTVLMTLTDEPLRNEPGYNRTRTDTHDAYRAVVTAACLDWIRLFLKRCGPASDHGETERGEASGAGSQVIRFCEDDDENTRVTSQFWKLYTDDFVKNDEYGKKLLELLRTYHAEGDNVYARWVKPYDLTTFQVTCYRAEYRLDFEPSRRFAAAAIADVRNEELCDDGIPVGDAGHTRNYMALLRGLKNDVEELSNK